MEREPWNDYQIAVIQFLPGLCDGNARFEVTHPHGVQIVTLPPREVEDLYVMLRSIVDRWQHPLSQLLREMERAHGYIVATTARNPVRSVGGQVHADEGATDGAIQAETGLPRSMEP